jgi:hypothetical protein
LELTPRDLHDLDDIARAEELASFTHRPWRHPPGNPQDARKLVRSFRGSQPDLANFRSDLRDRLELRQRLETQT